MAWNACAAARQEKRFRKRWRETARIHARPDRSARRPEGKAIGGTSTRGEEGEEVRARPLRAPVKSARARHRPAYFLISSSFAVTERECAAVGTTGGKRSRARCKRCRSLSALYPAAQVTRARFSSDFKHPWSTREGGREGCISLKRRRDGNEVVASSEIEKFQQWAVIINFAWNNNFVGRNEWNWESCRKWMVISFGITRNMYNYYIVLLEENCWKGNIG